MEGRGRRVLKGTKREGGGGGGNEAIEGDVRMLLVFTLLYTYMYNWQIEVAGTINNRSLLHFLRVAHF